MRSADDLFDEYSESHRNPVNKAIHWVCVPLITLSVLGLLAALPSPFAADWLNWSVVALGLALAYYARLSWAIALGMAGVSGLLLLGVRGLAGCDALPLWGSSLLIFVGAWVGQFIGHAIEGKKPSFFRDLEFLLVGPAWLLAHVYRALGVRY
ncbi:MAG: DUF962 domain-containing protein [Myxococcales bacterium]|nr:DUF962 domain-containing protein [Myxococcales bacterium]